VSRVHRGHRGIGGSRGARRHRLGARDRRPAHTVRTSGNVARFGCRHRRTRQPSVGAAPLAHPL